MLSNAEEKSYDKLVTQLQGRGMQYFDTPLVCSDTNNQEQKQFLAFMDTTMKLLRQKNKDLYT